MDVVESPSDLESIRRACSRALSANRLAEAESLLDALHARGEPEAKFNAVLARRLFAKGEYDIALRFAYRAWQSDEQNLQLLVEYAWTLKRAGQDEEALEIMGRAAQRHPERLDLHESLCSWLVQAGAAREAADLAHEIAVRWPDDTQAQRRASGHSERVGRFGDALAFARRFVGLNPGDAAAHRRLSALLTTMRYYGEAFQHASIAVELEPENPDLRVLLASHYRRMGRLSDAITELSVALVIDPQNRNALRSYSTLLRQRGLNAHSDLVRRRAREIFSDDPSFAESEDDAEFSGALTTLAGSLASDPTGVTEMLAARRPRRPPPATTAGYARWAIAIQARIIWALLLREVKTRYAHSALGIAWAVIEPLALLAILGFSMYVFRGTKAPLGNYYIVFHYTAIVLFLMFTHTTQRLTVSVRQQTLLRMPLVKLNDILIAKAMLEFFVAIVLNVFILVGFYLAGYQYWPSNPIDMLLAHFFVWLLALGVGITNCMIVSQFEAWEQIWANIGRAGYFISGIFYLPTQLPPEYLRFIQWNPLLYAIDWNRKGFYFDYDAPLLSKSYLIGCAVVSLAVGLALERLVRKDTLEYT